MEISDGINSLKGKKCWSVIAGSGTGSVVSLGFGEKKLKNRPIDNTALSEDERTFDPEVEIVIYCAWRLSHSDGVLCGWRDSNEAGGAMLGGLSLLREKKIINIQLCLKSYDLKLHFEGDICLNIFCDQTSDFDSDENYTLFVDNTAYTVGLKSKVEIEKMISAVTH